MVKRIQIITLATMLICVFLSALYSAMPVAYGASDLDEFYGGECKRVCKKAGGCTSAGCDGNCTGADNGTGCGDMADDIDDSWYCSEPIAGGGGCNLGSSASGSYDDCKCNNQVCGKFAGTGGTCTMVPSCDAD